MDKNPYKAPAEDEPVESEPASPKRPSAGVWQDVTFRAYTWTMHAHLGKTIARKLLGGFLISAGVGHLTFARREFQAQVPDWVPLQKDDTVVLSGLAEIALGSAIALAGPAHQKTVGRVAAAFFVAVFPGNVSQYVNRRSAFGLDTDGKRFARLFLQPALVYWALKST
jgi:uncharacterized membrane protein